MAGLHGHGAALLLLPLAGASALVLWVVRQQLRASPMQPEAWCFGLYIVGVTLIILGVLPPPDLQDPPRPGGIAGAQLSLVAGLVALLGGAWRHAVLVGQGKLLPAAERRTLLWCLPLVAAMGVAMAAAERAGYQRAVNLWVPMGLGVGTILLLGAWVLVECLRVALSRGNRIARLLQAERPEDAVRVGEAIPSEARDAAVEWNLAVAYEAVGRAADAAALWQRLGARSDLPEALAAALQQRLAERATPPGPG